MLENILTALYIIVPVAVVLVIILLGLHHLRPQEGEQGAHRAGRHPRTHFRAPG